MGSKRKKEGSKVPKLRIVEKLNEEVPTAPAEQQDNPMDFGGLPSRNLKKNLGCG